MTAPGWAEGSTDLGRSGAVLHWTVRTLFERVDVELHRADPPGGVGTPAVLLVDDTCALELSVGEGRVLAGTLVELCDAAEGHHGG